MSDPHFPELHGNIFKPGTEIKRLSCNVQTFLVLAIAHSQK